jgi:hypothetical protein
LADVPPDTASVAEAFRLSFKRLRRGELTVHYFDAVFGRDGGKASELVSGYLAGKLFQSSCDCLGVSHLGLI